MKVWVAQSHILEGWMLFSRKLPFADVISTVDHAGLSRSLHFLAAYIQKRAKKMYTDYLRRANIYEKTPMLFNFFLCA